jgi:hypothetical protein
MTILTTNNAESFGYKTQGGSKSGARSPGWNMPAEGVGASPNPAIGASINYVQGLQGESRTQTFAQGSQEGKSPTGGGTGGGGIMNGIKKIFGGGEGDAEAGSAAEDAGAGIAEDAAMVAV